MSNQYLDFECSMNFKYKGKSYEIFVSCDFDFDSDDPECNYYGKGWYVSDVHECTLSFTKDVSDEVRDAAIEWLSTEEFEEQAVDIIRMNETILEDREMDAYEDYMDYKYEQMRGDDYDD